MIKLYKALLIISSSIIVAGCPASARYVTLTNASTQPITVLHKDIYAEIEGSSVIGINQTKKELYYGCVSIKSDNETYDYNIIDVVPASYYTIKTFSSNLNAIYTNNHGLKVYNENNPNDFMELNDVCPYYKKP